MLVHPVSVFDILWSASIGFEKYESAIGGFHYRYMLLRQVFSSNSSTCSICGFFFLGSVPIGIWSVFLEMLVSVILTMPLLGRYLQFKNSKFRYYWYFRYWPSTSPGWPTYTNWIAMAIYMLMGLCTHGYNWEFSTLHLHHSVSWLKLIKKFMYILWNTRPVAAHRVQQF